MRIGEEMRVVRWVKDSNVKYDKPVPEIPEETGVEVVKVGSSEYEVFIEDIFREEDVRSK